mgnify:CR=1 FL=1
MAVKVADAFIALCLDTEQIEQEWQAIKQRIEADCIKICIDMSGVQAAQGMAAQIVQPIGLPAQSSIVSSAPQLTGASQAALTAASVAGLFADPTPQQPGWSLTDDLVASANLLATVGAARFGNTRIGQIATVVQETNAARLLGDSLMQGVGEGMRQQVPQLEQTIEEGIFRVLETGRDFIEARSPSRRSAREIGGPIMEGVSVGIMAGGPQVASALATSLGFAFNSFKAGLFGGTFVGSGLDVVANPGGMLGGGLAGFGSLYGQAIGNSFAVGQPTGLGEASRVLMSNIPMGIRDFGQNLLGGLLESVLPGWAAGPLGDMIGTFFGLKPILQPEAITAPARSADQGGFADYPYGGGTIFNVTNNFQGNFTDVERQVQLGILQSARRLGVSI